MKENKISFYSDRIKLRGSIYLPDNYRKGQRLPAVLANSGYTGLNAIYPRLFAEFFTAAGYAVMGFDYRGMGKSNGPKGRIILKEEAKDIENALLFLRAQKKVKVKEIFLLGWGMGAGLAVDVASRDEKLEGVAALNGFFDGKLFYKNSFSKKKLAALEREIEKERKKRVFTGKIKYVDPFEIYPLTPASERVVEEKLMPVEHYKIKVSFETAESIMDFNSADKAKDIKAPIFIAHGKHNKLHFLEQSRQLYKKANPPKKFYFIQGKHNDFMEIGHPVFRKLGDSLLSWFEENGAGPNSEPARRK